jgi:hypothetical protein
MRDVAEIIVPWVFVTLGLFALLDWDESRLPPEQLERAWPPATRTLALVYFGLLSLPIHYWRTRRTEDGWVASVVALRSVRAWGRLSGWAWGTGALGVDWGVSEVVDALPESALGTAIVLSVAGFTATMIWRSRKGRFWYQSARGH